MTARVWYTLEEMGLAHLPDPGSSLAVCGVYLPFNVRHRVGEGDKPKCSICLEMLWSWQ